ncbi:hypothetical protein M422DRAFT_158316 [Sphaerobolus stellatus SS14]|nr:hypothetical protein M422DRAFT_158316 [Sphaerobolus stellatus SS14]
MLESPAIPANPSPQLQVVLQWLDAWKTLNVDNVLPTLADDYKHQVLPKSLGRPMLNREEFTQNYRAVLPLYSYFEVCANELIEVPGKIFVHAMSSGKSTTGAPYNNEYCLTFYLVNQDDGLPKISYLKEFVDSKYSSEFFAGERERQSLKMSKRKM